MHRGVAPALLAAVLFGASTPLAKLLVGQLTPVLLAGLLYAGSGLGLCLMLSARRWRGRNDLPAAMQDRRAASLGKADLGWLAGAILAGGVAGPLLLLAGLRSFPASNAALLLNLEGVFTALFAWFVFHENFDRRILLGMAAIVAAGLILSWESGAGLVLAPGALAIAGACLCWALDNNLTRKIAASDAVQIAACKGVAAGAFNLVLAMLLGASWPPLSTALAAGLLGFCGYGASLVLFVLALRQLGSARTGAYFSIAPFAGAAIAIILLHETTGPRFWVAGGLMALGLWLHLTERHAHRHVHERLLHAHEHTHEDTSGTSGDNAQADPDPHHHHTHDMAIVGRVTHSHVHQHEAIAHTHAHFPDIHHRHRH
jgi:drug/metabolite transporter (DMT)-like permease